MSLSSELSYNMSSLSLSPKVTAFETSLQESLVKFKELAIGFDELYIEMETYKTELLTIKEKCESKSCSSSESLKEVIAAKDNIIQQVASILTKLNETKNFQYIKDIFKVVCSETTPTPPKDNIKSMTYTRGYNPDFSKVKKKLVSPKKELSTSLEDVSFKDDSVSEIEGTPTGRTSPIILSKKLRGVNVTETRDKKKCPENWPTPEKKSMKLHFPNTSCHTPRKGRLIQARLQVVTKKVASIVDLTSSPEASGGSREGTSEIMNDVQKLIKKESSENDDTILPSPTSGPKNFLLSRNSSKDKLDKFKRPLSLKSKTDRSSNFTTTPRVENNLPIDEITEMEESINILKPNRFPRIPQNDPHEKIKQKSNENLTHYVSDDSISLLQHVEKLENNNNDHEKSQILPYKSPAKRPLTENMNVINLPPEQCPESSMSLLCNGLNPAAVEDNAKRRSPEMVKPVYKEPTVRKKAEKQALPAWICEECKTFYGELYKDDPDAISKALDKCSKHRGRTNPARPRTPEGIWYPRWDVPDDTEEFNRRNNV